MNSAIDSDQSSGPVDLFERVKHLMRLSSPRAYANAASGEVTADERVAADWRAAGVSVTDLVPDTQVRDAKDVAWRLCQAIDNLAAAREVLTFHRDRISTLNVGYPYDDKPLDVVRAFLAVAHAASDSLASNEDWDAPLPSELDEDERWHDALRVSSPARIEMDVGRSQDKLVDWQVLTLVDAIEHEDTDDFDGASFRRYLLDHGRIVALRRLMEMSPDISVPDAIKDAHVWSTIELIQLSEGGQPGRWALEISNNLPRDAAFLDGRTGCRYWLLPQQWLGLKKGMENLIETAIGVPGEI